MRPERLPAASHSVDVTKKWYKSKIIIRITLFPLNDKFVFGDILFFLADILQLFAEWAKWAKLEGGGRGGAEKIARAEGP